MSLNIKKFLLNKSNDYSKLQDDFAASTNKSLIFDSCDLDSLVRYPDMLSASVVIPVWNGEDTILSTLTALEKSSFNQKYPQKLQVVVSDDGSSDNTLKLLKESQLNLNLTVIHQENHGQGPAMNAGISVAEGDIIIEVDADTVLNYYAIENLMFRHQFYKDSLYTGFRFYIDKDDPRVSLDFLRSRGPDDGFYFLNDERIKFLVPGWPNNMSLASNHYLKLGNSKGLWMANDNNNDPWILADMVFGMLFSLPRDIFKKIGGFDDRFKGWGPDDGYVGAKAISEGVFIIPVYTSTGFHIAHPFRTSDVQSEYTYNRQFFFEFINSTKYKGHPDWISVAKKRITSKFTHKPKHVSVNQNAMQKSTPKEFNIEQLLAIGKFEEAYKKLKIVKYKDEAYYIFLCKALNAMGRYKECIKILEAKNKLTSDLLFQLAMAYSSSGNFIHARTLLETISKSDPDYPELEYWLYRDTKLSLQQGRKYINEEFYKIARKCFEAALITDPNNQDAESLRNICISKI